MAHKLLGKLERMHPPGRPKTRWEDNIFFWDLKEVVMRIIRKDLSRIGLHDVLMAAMNLRIP